MYAPCSQPVNEAEDVPESAVCLVCGRPIDPLDPNSIALVVRAGQGDAMTRHAHIAHLPPLGDFEGPEGVVTVVGSPLG